jgi:hypothetical protein
VTGGVCATQPPTTAAVHTPLSPVEGLGVLGAALASGARSFLDEIHANLQAAEAASHDTSARATHTHVNTTADPQRALNAQVCTLTPPSHHSHCYGSGPTHMSTPPATRSEH